MYILYIDTISRDGGSIVARVDQHEVTRKYRHEQQLEDNERGDKEPKIQSRHTMSISSQYS